jgi:hypothetical protein
MIMTTLKLSALPIIFLAACSVIMLGSNPFNGETVAPTDILINASGWKNIKHDIDVRYPVRSDIVDARLPRWIHIKNTLWNGESPIWNPYPLNGIPGIQWLPAAMLTPAFLTFLVIPDNATGYYFALLVNLIIATTGSYLFLLALTGNRLASIFGAIVFSYSGFHAAWFFWAHVTTSIWIPWLLFLTYQYVTTGRKSFLPWLTIVISLMMFGGFPSVSVYAFIAMGVLFLIYAPWSKGVQSVAINAVYLSFCLFLAILITLFSIHSLYEMLQFTNVIDSRHGGTPLKLHHLKLFYQPLHSSRYPSVERTVYVGIIPLIFLLLAIGRTLRGKTTTNLLFAIILLSIAIAISFGILPKHVINAIPTFDKNNWNRIIVISCMAFSILTAEITAIYLKKYRSKYLLSISVTLLLILIQLFDLRVVFQRFNGPVPKQSFFTKTETIEHIQSTLKPLQSVIADGAYLISGTLTNYSIPEWFAHGFKTKLEYNVLEKRISPHAHKTPTAAIVRCEDINFSSKMLTLLGVKYLACRGTEVNGRYHRITLKTYGENTSVSAPINQNNPLIQYFSLTNKKKLPLDGLSLKLITNRDTDLNEKIIIRLFSDNIQIGSSALNLSQISEDGWATFDFPERILLKAGHYRLEVHSTTASHSKSPRARQYHLNSSDIYISHGEKKTTQAVVATQLLTSIHYYGDIELPKHIIKHSIEKGLTLLENTQVTGSGYSLPRLNSKQTPDFDSLKLLNSSATSYHFRYTGNQPAWVVLPLRHYPQWQAYVGNVPATVEAFMGMLPAIHVEPGTVVYYRYEPHLLYWLSLLSISTLIFVYYLGARWRNTSPRHTPSPITELR